METDAEAEEEVDLETELEKEATMQLEEEISKQDENSEPAKKKRRTALDQLKSYNQPTTKKTQEAEVEAGSMALIKEGNTLRLGDSRKRSYGTMVWHDITQRMT